MHLEGGDEERNGHILGNKFYKNCHIMALSDKEKMEYKS